MKSKLLKICYAAVVAALVCVCTMFVRIPVPATGGYLNIGDAMIYIGVFLLGPFAIPAAGIGSMFADMFAGAVHYMLPTLLIKTVMATVFWLITMKKDTMVLIIIASVASSLIMVFGYMAAELAMGYGIAAVQGLVANFIQLTFGVVLAPLAILGLKAVHFKKLVRIA